MRLTVPCLLLLAATAQAVAPAGALWYNGDANRPGTSYNNDITYGQRVYDDFTVPAGSAWTLTKVFSNNEMTATPASVTSVAYEIRRGVSDGNGGELLFSGTSTDFTLTPTGQVGTGNEYLVSVNNLEVVLTAGTYWLSVAPVLHPGSGYSFVPRTTGSGAVGTPPGNNGNAFSVYRYSNPPNRFNPIPLDFSMGVIGAATPHDPVVVSRKTHSGGGTYDIPLSVFEPPATECRAGGPNADFMLVFTFLNPVVSVGGASVTAGVGTISSHGFGAQQRQYVVNLTGVSDLQRLTVQLSNVTDAAGGTFEVVPATVRMLHGDTNGSGTVNTGDALQTRTRSGQPTDAGNFRSDVNADGFVNSGDVLVVRGRSGNSIP